VVQEILYVKMKNSLAILASYLFVVLETLKIESHTNRFL
jgi:hypothetical protein